MQMLSLGYAVAIADRTPEKLFDILNMYDALSVVVPKLEELLSDESGKISYLEVIDLQNALGDAAVGSLSEFEKCVRGEVSKKAVQGGDIHPMTRYVMNYVTLVMDYRNTLNQLLEKYEDEQGDEVDTGYISPLERRLFHITSSLEKNLEDMSNNYKDIHLGFIFMMNNISYMVQKVKDSELSNVLGDSWIYSHNGLRKNYAHKYIKGCWSTPLSFLKGVDVKDSSFNISQDATKRVFQEKIKSFNTCFDDIYRTQTGWKIKDPELRAEVRVMISMRLVEAYRWFRRWYGQQIRSLKDPKKYLKYSVDRLEEYLDDLFEGVPRDLTQLQLDGGGIDA